ncbi:MAG: hypothetical protein ACK456_15465 [Pseudanabaenaceae cyanobacterium]|jgi:hypothetical protein
MSTKIQEMIDKAQDRYLAADELGLLEEYVQSLPERLNLYRMIRDREVDLLQAVADRVPQELPNVQETDIETAIKDLILVLRYAAMAMLMNDEAFLKERLLKWLGELAGMRDLRRLNEALYKILQQVLKENLSASQVALIQPLITTAQVAVIY